jgi:hypothetical protein
MQGSTIHKYINRIKLELFIPVILGWWHCKRIPLETLQTDPPGKSNAATNTDGMFDETAFVQSIMGLPIAEQN